MGATNRKNLQRLNDMIAINLKTDQELAEYGKWTRRKVETMILVDVHQRDCFDELANDPTQCHPSCVDAAATAGRGTLPPVGTTASTFLDDASGRRTDGYPAWVTCLGLGAARSERGFSFTYMR